MAHELTRTEGRATAAAVKAWQVQSSAVAGGLDAGPVVSKPGFRAGGWLEAPARSTVMATLLRNGWFPGVEYSDRIRDEVDPAMFAVPWWYRTTFWASGDASTTVRSDGIIHRADLFVNGQQVGGSEEIAGAYTTNSFDVSDLVRPGLNALAYLVHPGSPTSDLSIGWVDWNWWPPDNNMGIWREVLLVRTGPIRLGNLRVNSLVDDDLSRAEMRVAVEAHNLTRRRVTFPVTAVVAPQGDLARKSDRSPELRVEQEVTLEGRASGQVVFTGEAFADLVLDEPALWWPIGEGAQPLYDLEVTATVDALPSDRARASFGIRSVTSHVEEGGGRRFVVNGRPVVIRGAGWAPDLWLRHDHQRLRDELAYAADVGLNTIRLEGKLENPEIYELADEMGLMMLPGWECCDKWEAHAGSGEAWDEGDFDIAARSMSSEAHRLANHPCVVGFFVGSDHPPEPRAARLYLEALREAGFDAPVISSATVVGSDVTGPSGMKMTGPYAWVPPGYWYRADEGLGGAVGFNSETGCGNNLPRRPSLERMLSPADLEALWSQPAAKQTHAAPPSVFDNLEIFHCALAGRYGSPSSLEDFLRKAHLANYEAVRAQFEAYGSRSRAARPATGMVYWMLNSAWPSLNWQLWDWYLDPGPPYFAAKKANEPVHVQYAYDEHAVQVVNRYARPTGRLAVWAAVRVLEGEVAWSAVTEVEELAAGETATVMRVVVPESIEGCYFLELTLEELADLAVEGPPAASCLSRNVYWLSTVPDVLAVDETMWQYTPVKSFADLTGLATLPMLTAEDLDISVHRSNSAGSSEVSLTVANAASAGTPLLGLHASVVTGERALVSPIRWEDNDVVLFAEQSVTLRAEFDSSLVRGDVSVELEGFNLVGPVVAAAAVAVVVPAVPSAQPSAHAAPGE